MKPLSDELITELQGIMKKHGHDLTHEETAETGEALVTFFDTLIQMDNENKASKQADHDSKQRGHTGIQGTV